MPVFTEVTYVPLFTAKKDRRFADILLVICDKIAGPMSRAGFTTKVTLDRARGTRRYMLEFYGSLRGGAFAWIDVARREVWIRPSQGATTDLPIVDSVLDSVSEKTLLIDHLLNEAEAAGFTILPGSETRKSLRAWREERALA